MREGVKLGLDEFMIDLVRLKGEQEHFIEEVKNAFAELIKIKSTQIKNLQNEVSYLGCE